MSELLFEAYGVPSVVYGIDSAFSHYYNHPESDYALIVSLGNTSTTILPFCNGRVLTENCHRYRTDPIKAAYNADICLTQYRISFGATQAYEHMLKLLKHKYPNFPLKIDIGHAQVH